MSTDSSLPPQLAKPTLLNYLSECRAPFEFASLILYIRSLSNAPKGDGRPIMLAPGYLANDYSMFPLGRYLRYLGYDVYYAQMGVNMGKFDTDMMRLGARTESIATDLNDAKLTIIGWSLGGSLAREAARLFPHAVREVITMGTPIVGGGKFTTIGSIYAKLNKIKLEELELDIHQRNSIGLTQPVTSIYSKSDGIVGWQASVDTYNKQANNIEVTGSHLGLGWNPKVWLMLADILASKQGNQ